MLSAVRKSDSNKVLAWEESKSSKPFFCPECIEEVILKKGTMKIHHFAHKPPVTCEYGGGETEKHRQCKMAIYEGLKGLKRFQNVEVERGMGTVRPDVSAYMDGIRIAIEVQISTLTMQQIISRTIEYTKKGIYVLWLGIYHHGLVIDRFSPKLWERWVHAAYFGRVYYWVGELEIVPYHFGECHHYVEPRSWYTEDGDEESAGGYEKRYTRFKTPKNGRVVSLSDSFVPKYRDDPWRSKTLTIPESRLLMDTQRIWWKSEV